MYYYRILLSSCPILPYSLLPYPQKSKSCMIYYIIDLTLVYYPLFPLSSFISLNPHTPLTSKLFPFNPDSFIFYLRIFPSLPSQEFSIMQHEDPTYVYTSVMRGVAASFARKLKEIQLCSQEEKIKVFLIEVLF